MPLAAFRVYELGSAVIRYQAWIEGIVNEIHAHGPCWAGSDAWEEAIYMHMAAKAWVTGVIDLRHTGL